MSIHNTSVAAFKFYLRKKDTFKYYFTSNTLSCSLAYLILLIISKKISNFVKKNYKKLKKKKKNTQALQLSIRHHCHCVEIQWKIKFKLQITINKFFIWIKFWKNKGIFFISSNIAKLMEHSENRDNVMISKMKAIGVELGFSDELPNKNFSVKFDCIRQLYFLVFNCHIFIILFGTFHFKIFIKFKEVCC